ncbi:MAG TPA: isochorismate synthase, partial [Acidimicrobiales bacterium]|nr:isochorismate synthase [Acidimicrobiales bacterium]
GGRGVAAVLSLPDGLADYGALEQVQAWLAAVPHRQLPIGGSGSGGYALPAVTALGALPFDRSAPGHLCVPELLVRIAGDGRRWATAVVTGPEEPDAQAVVRRAAALLEPAPPLAEVKTPAVLQLSENPSGDGYRAAVAEALERAARGTLDKVVLSRAVTARFAGPVTTAAAVRRLRRGEPSCTVFAFPTGTGPEHDRGGGGARFLGASPELLVRRVGATVESHPLAGTAGLDPGAGNGDAGKVAEHLLASTKDRVEHRLVVEAVAAALRARCTELLVPDEPSLVRLGSVAHLGTALRGTLRPDGEGRLPPALVLLADLHPTPAVGGVPRDEALICIAELESTPRGHWAGPVGWVDSSGDGQWMIGIRSATVDGASASLTAGAGIVAGSDPRAELEETTVKLVPVLEALAPGAGRLLDR